MTCFSDNTPRNHSLKYSCDSMTRPRPILPRQLQTPEVQLTGNTVQKHKKMPRIYLCPHCANQFRNSGNRNRHAKTCDLQPNASFVDLRPFECQFCRKRFKDESNARAHARRGACIRSKLAN